MRIAVAGPYSAETDEQRAANLATMNRAAAKLLEMGHVPIIGVNAALEVMRYANVPDEREAIMQISLSVVDACDALLLIGESPGANRERDLMISKGRPVYHSIDQVPASHLEK